MFLSSSKSGLAVVSSFSPVKIELAPAIKHNACSATDIRTRPADKRTRALGIVMRAVAIMRSISQIDTSG